MNVCLFDPSAIYEQCRLSMMENRGIFVPVFDECVTDCRRIVLSVSLDFRRVSSLTEANNIKPTSNETLFHYLTTHTPRKYR